MFQFLNGTIKILPALMPVIAPTCFNSSMVRLKFNEARKKLQIPIQFQFLNGTIKITRLKFFFHIVVTFQFLNGTIKISTESQDSKNVIKFQFLNGTIKISGSSGSAGGFQFLNGTIKMPPHRAMSKAG